MAAMTLPTRDPGAAAPGGIRRALLAGLLWDGVGPHAPFWFGAGCAAAAVVLLGFINRRSRAGSPEADRERASRT